MRPGGTSGGYSVVFSHEGIATEKHIEVRILPRGRAERNEQPGYEWTSCVKCGSEFERGKGWGQGEGPMECGNINCGKVAV